MEIWQQLSCPTCGSNQVEFTNGFLCCKVCKSRHTLQEKISEEEVIALNVATSERNMLKFEDALERYEQILAKSPNNEMANWGALLSDYGILYVQDYNGAYLPTCHRLSERPIAACPYYAKLNAEHKIRAAEIENLRASILEKAEKIPPYDVFLCYKATEEVFGRSVPTKEAGWARDMYMLLKHELKLNVFFAEESLLGDNSEWEPHIYKALNTAKLMFVITTGKENVNSPWVKNEWKRFSRYIKEGQEKTIRVVYDIMNAYDLPKELQATQAISHNSMGWGEAVRKAAENVFGQRNQPRIPLWEQEFPQEDTQRTWMSSYENPQDFLIENNKLKKYTGSGKTAVLPEGITAIGRKAFEECLSLINVVIPESVTKIEDNAFYGCKNLKSVTIPDSVRDIGAQAFRGCESLVNVALGENVTNIGEECFAFCKSLTGIVLGDNLTVIRRAVFNDCTALTSVTMGKRISTLEKGAFYGCSKLSKVSLPDSVRCIGEYAFGGCSALTEVTLPDSVNSIGEGAFKGCKSLTAIVLPRSVENIAYRAFLGCERLTVYACANKKPHGWSEKHGGFFGTKVVDSWNVENRPVVWGHKGERLVSSREERSKERKGKTCKKWVSFGLCLFLGAIGAHKFYEGKTMLGILYLFTGGLFSLGWFIDIFVILSKNDPYYVE